MLETRIITVDGWVGVSCIYILLGEETKTLSPFSLCSIGRGLYDARSPNSVLVTLAMATKKTTAVHSLKQGQVNEFNLSHLNIWRAPRALAPPSRGNPREEKKDRQAHAQRRRNPVIRCKPIYSVWCRGAHCASHRLRLGWDSIWGLRPTGPQIEFFFLKTRPKSPGEEPYSGGNRYFG